MVAQERDRYIPGEKRGSTRKGAIACFIQEYMTDLFIRRNRLRQGINGCGTNKNLLTVLVVEVIGRKAFIFGSICSSWLVTYCSSAWRA